MRNAELKPLFDTIERVFAELHIDYYLIGALARQIWYEQADLSFRTTKDVDFAILIGSHLEYQNVKNLLISREGYQETKENAFILLTPNGTQVDLLPFGKIETDGSVRIEGSGMTSIKVDGMKEVFEYGTQGVALETGNFFKVATLSAIVLLKLIAYDDRPEIRQKDAGDIGNILLHFFPMHDNLIYDFHNDLFGEEERTLETIGSVVIGREIQKIGGLNGNLMARVNSILVKHIDGLDKSDFNRLVAREIERDISEIVLYLKGILWGLENPSTSI